MSLQSTDQIADLLTRIRNAIMVGKTDIYVPTSKLKVAVIEGLKKANYKAPVSIESCYRDIYTDPEDFYKKCYQKAIEIANHL